jgi:hypothetical protein
VYTQYPTPGWVYPDSPRGTGPGTVYTQFPALGPTATWPQRPGISKLNNVTFIYLFLNLPLTQNMRAGSTHILQQYWGWVCRRGLQHPSFYPLTLIALL